MLGGNRPAGKSSWCAPRRARRKRRPARAVTARRGNLIFVQSPRGSCYFIGEDNLCAIEQRHGKELKPGVCVLFPFNRLGRLGNDVLAHFTRVLTARITQTAPRDLDPTIAALALVAMLERLNYYALGGQVRAGHDDIVDTLARVTQRGMFGP